MSSLSLRSLTKVFVCLGFLLAPSSLLANWTLNLGYHNPPSATVGLNFMYYTPAWAFEVGIGWVDAGTDDEEDTSNTTNEEGSDSITLKASGALNFKYFLGYGGVRPYFQIGVGAGVGAKAGEEGDFGAGVGGGYAGLGILAGSPSLYVYGSYNIGSHENGFVQFGFGFDI